jgi:DNA-binding transcriptional MerR regulator
MRIGEIAHRSGLSRDTIRFYERNGLIDSAPGSGPTNSYREYDEDLVERLKMIREAQAAGFTIADLFLFIRQLENAAREEFDADAFLDRKIAEIENNIERSQRFLETLHVTKQALSGANTDMSTALLDGDATSADRLA